MNTTVSIAVSVTQASGDKFKANKHNKMPLILNGLNGTLPKNSGILDGTVSERLGIRAGGQYVIGIKLRGYYKKEEYGDKYPNYDYVLVTTLGAGFENLIAKQVVASMDFGFGAGTPTPTEDVEAITPTPTPEDDDAPKTKKK